MEELESALPASAARWWPREARADVHAHERLGRGGLLGSLRGKPVVLYFYPKDDTPGCTAQACGIRDAWGEFERTGAVVLAVSPDKPSEHVKFREKYGLPFTLLSDTEHEVAQKFVIEADGNVAKIMRNVKPTEHADDVLEALV